MLPATHLCAALTPSTPSEPSGSWDSIHVFEVAERGRSAHYKLTSTVMLNLINRLSGEMEAGPDGKGEGWKHNGDVTLSGSMTRQVRLGPTANTNTNILAD